MGLRTEEKWKLDRVAASLRRSFVLLQRDGDEKRSRTLNYPQA